MVLMSVVEINQLINYYLDVVMITSLIRQHNFAVIIAHTLMLIGKMGVVMDNL
jgi:hypothetical protein